MKKGSLIIVGTGLSAPAHLSQETISQIRAADVVHHLFSDPLGKSTVEKLNNNCKDLGDYYYKGKNRLESYNIMVDEILKDVRKGKNVCTIFYGHPGVFVHPSHKSIRIARKEGYSAKMLPAISAEDCLIADLGIDPGGFGCQQYETSQFMFYQHIVNPHAAMILWQIGLAGDATISTDLKPAKDGLVMLKESLLNWYPEDHQITLYEAAVLPIMPPRIEHLTIGQLDTAKVNVITTLYIPAVTPPPLDQAFCDKWGINTP